MAKGLGLRMPTRCPRRGNSSTREGADQLLFSAQVVSPTSLFAGFITWGLPKIRGALFWGPYNKDPTI